MTISSTIRKAGPFVGNSTATVFPFAFKVFAAADLLVVQLDTATDLETELALNSGYTVALNANQDANPGGTVTLPAVLATGQQLVITSDIEALQATDLTNQGGFYPRVISNALDKLTILIQQMLDGLSRSIKAPVSDATSDMTLPTAAARAGQFLAFDALGNPVASAGGGSDAALRTDLAASTGATLIGGLRQKLTASRDYYVRTDGSNGNTGLANTAGGAFLTIQKAIDTIMVSVDLNGFDVRINVGNGARTSGGAVAGPWVGTGDVYVIGNTATPSSCSVTVAGGPCFSLINDARLKVSGFKVSTTGSGNCLQAYLRSTLDYGSMDFGACAENHVESGQGSYVSAVASYTISGGAVGHLHQGSFGAITVGNYTLTLTGTPAFSSYFMGVAQGAIIWDLPTIVGTATGQKFLAHFGGIIRTNGTFTYSSIPGSVTGTMEAGGIVVGSTSEALSLSPDTYPASALTLDSINFNTRARVTHFKVLNDLFVPKGYFFTNGDGCYSTGETYLAGDNAVDVTSGTADGIDFRSKSLVASNFPVFHASANATPVGYLRRRGSDGSILDFWRNTGQVGSISVTAAGTTYNTLSDYRVKQNVAPIADAWGRVKAMRPVQYEFKVQPGVVVSGFIAHELAQVVPGAVTGEKDAEDAEGRPVYQSVDTGRLVADLTAALQQAMARIEALESAA